MPTETETSQNLDAVLKDTSSESETETSQNLDAVLKDAPSKSKIKQDLEDALKKAQDEEKDAKLNGFRVQVTVYNKMPQDSGWYIEYGECLFWTGAGEKESSGRRYTDTRPGSYYRDFSVSANKCMRFVAIVLTVLHKPSGTRRSISVGPNDAGEGYCWITPEYQIAPRQFISEDELGKTSVGEPTATVLPL